MHQIVIIVSWCRKNVRTWYRGSCIINQVGHQNPLKPESIIHATSPAGRRGSWTRRSSLGFWARSRKHTKFLLQLVRPASGARSAWPIVRANKHFVILFAVTAFKFVDRHLLICCVFLVFHPPLARNKLAATGFGLASGSVQSKKNKSANQSNPDCFFLPITFWALGFLQSCWLVSLARVGFISVYHRIVFTTVLPYWQETDNRL